MTGQLSPDLAAKDHQEERNGPRTMDKCTGDSCKCPPGMVGVEPFCRPAAQTERFGEVEPRFGQVSPPMDKCTGEGCKCPEGMVGVEPFCRPADGGPQPADRCVGESCKCPPGTTGVQPFCRPIEQGTTDSLHGPFSYRGQAGSEQCAVIQCPPGVAGPPGPPGPPGPSGAENLVDRMQGDDPRTNGDQKSLKAAGFTAYLTHDMTATLARPIVFQETLTNTGRHYDVDSGKFVAPMNGLYHFEFHVMFRRGASASPVVDLMRNGKSLASAWRTQRNRHSRRSTRGAHHSGQSRHHDDKSTKSQDVEGDFLHNSLLLELEEGDEVWLQLYWNSIMGGRYLKPTTFSGYLVAGL